MSNRYITAAMEMQVGSPTKKLILIKLADNANDDGVCWPSYGTIARHCGVDKRTVMRHIKQLEDMGVLAKKHRMTSHGNTSNVFQIYIPAPALTRGDNLSLGGDSSDTRGVTVGSPRGCHPCHPEPSLEPSLEPKDKSTPKGVMPDAVKKWNDFASRHGLAEVRIMTPNRKKNIASAYKNYLRIKKAAGEEPKSQDDFLSALVDVALATHTEFHLGKNERNWQMSFDYLLRNKTIDKVTEYGSID